METYQPESDIQQPAETEAHEEADRLTIKQFTLDTLETLILAVILFLGINAISARVQVDGTSMRPTLEDGEFILVSKLSYQFGTPERGDIIVFRPLIPGDELIKRVIGLPGDTITIEDGRVYVNGLVLSEPYIAAPPVNVGSWTIPEDHIFVMGDNRNNSQDSRNIGAIPLENVIGKAILIYWPPPEWNIISHTNVAMAAP
ncbi:MAG: signal peptidase I [Anaerolineales bacterium]|nr:signal peptidase I [Anaerolineales bacterium]